MAMKRGTITGIVGTIIVAGFSLGAFADVKENPYQVIIERNPFGLKPVPPPPEAPKQEAPVTPPPEIKLTGITGPPLGASPKAFLQVEDKQTKKAEFLRPLAAGEDDKGITIVSIDVENSTVRIRNAGGETTLDFEKNGVKPAASAAPVPPAAGLPLKPGVPVPPPAGLGFNPGNPANAAAAAGRTAIVSGGTTTATPGAVFPNTYGANPATYGANPAMGGLPQRPLRTDSAVSAVSIGGGAGGQVYNPNPHPVVSQQPAMSRDEAEARIEAARRMLEQQNNPQSRILPPTSLGRALNPPPVPGGQ